MNTTLETPDVAPDVKNSQASPSRGQKALRALSFRNIGAVYVLALIVLIFPLCTRTFDLSIGFVATLAAVISTYAIAHGVPLAPAVALAIGAALVVGVVNALV